MVRVESKYRWKEEMKIKSKPMNEEDKDDKTNIKENIGGQLR